MNAPAPHPELHDRHFVLATDLDGTFLGGSAGARATLYRWIENNRQSVGLIFVTGRDPEAIDAICRAGVPWPDYVIGDVGTTIAEVTADRRIAPIPTLEAEIARRWGALGDSARAALDGRPGLALQDTAFRYRLSYDMDPGVFDTAAVDAVERLGLDVLISDDRYLDVLPPAVSKGPSLRRLIAHLGLDERRILAAGDTLNDLSMLTLGLPAVAVGGSEPALIERLAGLDHVHFAAAEGAAGILDAIQTLNLHPVPQGSLS